MQLTQHFQLIEFTRSGTASRYGINNSLDPDNPQHKEIIANLCALCENVLEPLRAFVNQSSPIEGGERVVFISSGYRCPQLNNHPEVRGAAKSQHLTGEAADIRIPDEATGKKWFTWIMDNCNFDQLIYEHNRQGTYWIHVSYSRKINRQYVISSMWKK